MLHTISTTKSIDQAGKDLEAASARHEFGVLAVHDLRDSMKKKGVDFARACRVYEICHPQQAKRVLEEAMQISTALPCRIAIYEEGGSVKLSTLLPTAMLALFDRPALAPVAKEVEREIVAIMDEAAQPAPRPAAR